MLLLCYDYDIEVGCGGDDVYVAWMMFPLVWVYSGCSLNCGVLCVFVMSLPTVFVC